MPESIPLADAKARFSEIVERVVSQQERVVVTRNGRAAAVLVSPDDLESLEETLAVLSDPILLSQVREGRAAAGAGDVVPLAEIRERHSQASGD